ncbi:MAG: trehalose-phosphatase [Bdellovibrionales bacterium]|nr:trehalose-phosphatase [Bdellovibrionales bacterium]
MKNILLEENQKILALCSPSNTVYGFDFDGTLAPIVGNPDDARISETTSALLCELNAIATVAIITGRSIEDVQPYLPFTPKYLVGNHGIEGILDEVALKEIQTTMAGLKKLLLTAFEDDFRKYSIVVEDKIYSLSLHYRDATVYEAAKSLVENFMSQLSTYRIVKGKMVLNILPNRGACKGSAFLKILRMENAQQGIFLGDDETDEDVFILKDSKVIGIKVGPVERTHAAYFMEHQTDVNALLEILLKHAKKDF